MNRTLALLLTAGLFSLLTAADADYTTQHDNADKAFNELEGSPTETDKDLELKRKELEIERLKLELEKRDLAEEKQKLTQNKSAQQPSHKTIPTTSKQKQEGVFFGIESFSAVGTRTARLSDASGELLAEDKSDIEYTQKTLKLGLIVEGHRVALGLTSGKDIKTEYGSLYKKGQSVDLSWDMVSDAWYDQSSSSNILPFLRLGLGIGTYEHLDENKIYYVEDTADTVEMKFGLGVYYQINNIFELAASYEWMIATQSYQDSTDNTLDIADLVSGIVLGINFHF